jgi:septal ring factor EnvC (AmiA/AmiB activator)
MATHGFSAGVYRKIQVAAWLFCSGFLSGDLHAATPSLRGDDSLARQVEADWAAQERRWKRTPDSPQAVRAALQRGERLLADLGRAMPETELEPEAATLRGLRADVDAVDHMASEQRAALYLQLRWATRNLALKNPLLAGKPLVFMKRHRFVSQMLHEYLGYFYDYGDVAGGGCSYWRIRAGPSRPAT